MLKMNDKNKGIKATKNRENHSPYINKPLSDYYNIAFKFNDNEQRLLSKYGSWLEALIEKKIEAYTDAQKRFIDVALGYQKAISDFEKLWIKVLTARKHMKKLATNCNNKSFDPPRKKIHEVGSAAAIYSKTDGQD